MNKKKKLLALSTVLALVAGGTAYKYFNNQSKEENNNFNIEVINSVYAVYNDNALYGYDEDNIVVMPFVYEGDVYFPLSSLSSISLSATINESIELDFATENADSNNILAMRPVPSNDTLLIEDTKEVMFNSVTFKNNAILIDGEWFVPSSVIENITKLQIEYYTDTNKFYDVEDNNFIKVLK